MYYNVRVEGTTLHYDREIQYPGGVVPAGNPPPHWRIARSGIVVDHPHELQSVHCFDLLKGNHRDLSQDYLWCGWLRCRLAS